MRANYLTSALAIVALSGTWPIAAHAVNEDNNNSEHKWMTKPPVDHYWQAPDFTFPSAGRTDVPATTPPRPAPPANNYAYRPPRALSPADRPAGQMMPAYRPPSYPARSDRNRPAMNRPYTNMAGPVPNPNRRQPLPPPPRGANYGPDNGASAYYMPGYNPGGNYGRNRRWNNNKFWGRSGPRTWTHPGKRNWENSWDDMMNAPSRMGDMPGGWSAPEVTMPNPVDIGDQMQDNVKDLPDQIRDADIGN